VQLSPPLGSNDLDVQPMRALAEALAASLRDYRQITDHPFRFDGDNPPLQELYVALRMGRIIVGS
jgi:hypothetical protein